MEAPTERRDDVPKGYYWLGTKYCSHFNLLERGDTVTKWSNGERYDIHYEGMPCVEGLARL